MATPPDHPGTSNRWARTVVWIGSACILLAAGWLAGDFRVDSAKIDRHPARIALWDRPAAAGEESNAGNAYVTVYRPSRSLGTALVICPGGGYESRVMEIEGHGIARWLNRQGIAGIVLEYRLPHGDPALPLRDVRQAVRYVRSHAEEWGLRSNRVGVIGFSAGGHLAAMAAVLEECSPGPAGDLGGHPPFRPDFAVLIYPVISMGLPADAGSRRNLLGPSPPAQQIEAYSMDRQVTPRTPPAFLVHAQDDSVVSVENSRLFYNALKSNGVSATICEYETGGHGLGYGGALWREWQAQALHWLRSREFLSAGKER